MEYRKHWLINSLGERYDFTNKDFKVFLNQPRGFGLRKSFSSIYIGNSEIVTSQQTEMLDITGEIVFYDGSIGKKYNDYQQFIQFCKYTPLEFHYQTPNELNSSYHCSVVLTELDKSEVSSDDNILHVPVTFHRLTQWLADDTFVMVLDNNPVGDGKYLDFYYRLEDGDVTGNPATSYYNYAGTPLNDSEIINDGTDDVGFQIEVIGTVQNMQFSLSQNGVVYGVCKINGTYDKVLINSVEREESIYLERNNSVIANPEQYQDFTIGDGMAYLTWCKIKVGTSHFSFTAGNISTFTGHVKITFNKSYITV